MKLAVIDLGTNTCNLLIAQIKGRDFQVIHQSKLGVKLGKGGINKRHLTPEAFNRAKEALLSHQQTIKPFQVDQLIAIATSAVRDAANQLEFETFLLQETGIQLQTISGEKEAQLIFKGVQLAMRAIPDEALILDIGGGSNEFIEIRNGQMNWKSSFPLGMARIIDQFSLSDPITKEELSIIEKHFEEGLTPLWSQLQNLPVPVLIGCSGAFDTLADLLDGTAPGSKARRLQDIPLADFDRISAQIIHSTKQEREGMTGMEPLRVEMIVPAFILMRLVVSRLKIQQLKQTDFALREGVLFQAIYD